MATDGIESAVRWLSDDARADPFGVSPDWQRALRALARSVEAGRGVAVFDGPDGSGKSSGLRELIRRLPPVFRVVRLAGEAMSCAQLSGRILDVLEVQQGRDAQHLVALHAARLRAQGRSLVLLVDDADTLPDETVGWLASLMQPRATGVRVVLATRDYVALLDALAGLGICVDLVRLAVAVASPALGDADVERPPAPAAPPAAPDAEPALAVRPEPPEPAASALGEEPAQEPIAAPAREAPTEQRSAEPEHDRFMTVEELLGIAEPPSCDLGEPDAERGADAATLPERGEPPSSLPVREPEPARPEVGLSPAAAPLQSAPATVSANRAPPAPTLEPGAPRGSTGGRTPSHVVHWLVAGCAALGAVVWLVLPVLWGRPAASISTPYVSEPISSDRAPLAPSHSTAATAERAADPPSQAAAAVETVAVSDLRQALELLGAGPVGDSHVAAVHFLREHGPDAEGYALLDVLEARRPQDPEEAATLLAARSRVRAGLCAAWADDVRGEAPRRLGCPGARSAAR